MILIMAVVGTFTVCAQSPVVRVGNSYLVNGKSMNKVAFNDYLSKTCPDAFAKFDNGYKLSKTGWGLFGGGVGLCFASVVCGMVGAVNISQPEQVNGLVGASVAMGIVGDCMTTAGIVCLGVGYGRMHNAADMHNVGCVKKPVAEFHLTTGGNTIGIACRF